HLAAHRAGFDRGTSVSLSHARLPAQPGRGRHCAVARADATSVAASANRVNTPSSRSISARSSRSSAARAASVSAAGSTSPHSSTIGDSPATTTLSRVRAPRCAANGGRGPTGDPIGYPPSYRTYVRSVKREFGSVVAAAIAGAEPREQPPEPE